MRQVIDSQMQLGEQTIAAIVLDPNSRDDIPQLLCGLQYIDTTPGVRERVFAILEQILPPQPGNPDGAVDPNNGRPGMSQWEILVLGVMRLGLDADYDRLQQLANEHKTLREMLGHSDFAKGKRYALQTLRDNVRLLTPELMDRINQEVVRAGHAVLGKAPDEALAGRCDSTVVKTDVHYPTDISLLWDAVRCLLTLGMHLAEVFELPGWRQSAYHKRMFKKPYRQVQRLQRSNAKHQAQCEQQAEAIATAYQPYLDLAYAHLARAHILLQALPVALPQRSELLTYMAHMERLTDQIDRRVLKGETIPHSEKVFSIFEPHTEWLSKGKAGVPVELGLPVCILEDRDRFILHYQVMVQCTDVEVAVAMVEQAQHRFPALNAVSMDKGFHSPANQADLAERLDQVTLPKKGKRSKAEQAREQAPAFVDARRQHSAVESAMNAIKEHGLERCPDHGLDGFRRYVGLAVLSRNVQRLGAVLRQQAHDPAQRRRGCYQRHAA